MRTSQTLPYSEYMVGSDGIPVDPLKPCAAPGHTILPGGVPMHPEMNTYTQRGRRQSRRLLLA